MKISCNNQGETKDKTKNLSHFQEVCILWRIVRKLCAFRFYLLKKCGGIKLKMKIETIFWNIINEIY